MGGRVPRSARRGAPSFALLLRREFFARLAREAADSGETHSVCAFSLMNDNVTIFGIWQSPSSVEKMSNEKMKKRIFSPERPGDGDDDDGAD